MRVVLAVPLLLAGPGAGAAISLVGANAATVGSASTTTLVVPRPAGVAAGDVMIVQVAARDGVLQAITPPAGWTLVLRTNDPLLGIFPELGLQVASALYWRAAGAAEPGSYTFTVSRSERVSGGIVAFRGVDAVAPIDAKAGVGDDTDTAVVAPSITTTVAGTQRVAFFASANGSVSFTPPGGTSERYDVATGSGSSGAGAAAADVAQPTAGASGTATATASVDAPHVGQHVALAPASGGATLDHFTVGHDGGGIHCLAETVTVAARDGSGTLLGGYAGAVTLTTQTGRGTWSLASGSGVFLDALADDGVATYAFVGDDGGSAQFLLSYPEGASPIDVDVYETATPLLRDDDSEGTLAFAPSGFTVTANALANPPPATIDDDVGTQVAGATFSVHLAAYGQTPTDPACGVIEGYTGAKAISAWMSYDDPASGSVVATLAGVPVGASQGAASTHAVTFTAGQASVAMKYKDAGRIRVHYADATLSPAVQGSSAAFVVRPADLVVVAVTDALGAPNPGASTATGAAFTAAGAPFSVRVEARDAEGSPTPGFGLESSPEGVTIASSTLVLPAAGRNGAAGDGAIGGAGTFTRIGAGLFESGGLSFDEVGVIRLRASVADGDYLGSGSLTGTESGNVGRFHPAAVELLAGSTVTPACTTFTWLGQSALGVAFTLVARAAGGGVVRNYDTALLGAGAVAAVVAEVEDANDGVDLAARLDLPAGTWVQGAYAVDTATASVARASAPDGPFDALRIGLRLDDALDGLAVAGADMAAAADDDCVAAASCTARAVGTPVALRYGRLSVRDGHGPEVEPIGLRIVAERWHGSGFEVADDDDCTTFSAASATLGAFSGNLQAGHTSLLSPLAATALVRGANPPAAPLVLAAPGAGHDGSVRVTLAVPAWLRHDWTGGGASDPSATASFGRFRGHDRIVFRRELR
jgi:hypothetical protein